MAGGRRVREGRKKTLPRRDGKHRSNPHVPPNQATTLTALSELSCAAGRGATSRYCWLSACHACCRSAGIPAITAGDALGGAGAACGCGGRGWPASGWNAGCSWWYGGGGWWGGSESGKDAAAEFWNRLSPPSMDSPPRSARRDGQRARLWLSRQAGTRVKVCRCVPTPIFGTPALGARCKSLPVSPPSFSTLSSSLSHPPLYPLAYSALASTRVSTAPRPQPTIALGTTPITGALQLTRRPSCPPPRPSHSFASSCAP